MCFNTTNEEMCLVMLLLVYASASPGFFNPVPEGWWYDIGALSLPALLSYTDPNLLALSCKSYFTNLPLTFCGNSPIVLDLIYGLWEFQWSWNHPGGSALGNCWFLSFVQKQGTNATYTHCQLFRALFLNSLSLSHLFFGTLLEYNG